HRPLPGQASAQLRELPVVVGCRRVARKRSPAGAVVDQNPHILGGGDSGKMITNGGANGTEGEGAPERLAERQETFELFCAPLGGLGGDPGRSRLYLHLVLLHKLMQRQNAGQKKERRQQRETALLLDFACVIEQLGDRLGKNDPQRGAESDDQQQVLPAEQPHRAPPAVGSSRRAFNGRRCCRFRSCKFDDLSRWCWERWAPC